MAVQPMMEGVMSVGIHGMHTALKGTRQAAQEIAELNLQRSDGGGASSGPMSGPSETYVEDAIEALTDLKLYQRQVQASAKVVETADAMMGFLLDVHA